MKGLVRHRKSIVPTVINAKTNFEWKNVYFVTKAFFILVYLIIYYLIELEIMLFQSAMKDLSVCTITLTIFWLMVLKVRGK